MKQRRTNKVAAFLLSAIGLIFVIANETAAQQRSISGRLVPTVEAGGWLIVEAKEKYLLLNAEKFKNESWFRAGTEVSATGEIKRDAVTIYQEGIPFEARTLRPAENSTVASNRLTTVTVSGNARVTAQPDMAIISISIVTQSSSALEAQQQNAVKTTAVINALQKIVPGAAEIKTSGYSLVPQRVYKENLPPTISGYEGRNSVLVTLNDLNRVGAVIDAATGAGANNVEGISFILRNDGEVRRKALTEATREAIDKANALAQALGGRLVRIIAVEESGGVPRPVIYAQREAMAVQTTDTPIEIGTLEINSQVLLIGEIERN